MLLCDPPYKFPYIKLFCAGRGLQPATTSLNAAHFVIILKRCERRCKPRPAQNVQTKVWTPKLVGVQDLSWTSLPTF